jgi:biopolymer transport protein ExbB
MKRVAALFALLILLPLSANAWWNGDWKNRKKITLVTSPEGADVKDAVGPIPIAVRLHAGNFLFTDAKPDGTDIRFVANDDKTPLKHFVEVFDSANQIAILWVQIPRISGASSAEYIWMYSGNDRVGAADDPKAVYDPAQVLALNFGEAQGPFKDSTAYANPVSGEGVAYDASGLAGGAARFSGQPLKVDTVPSVRTGNAGVSFSAWVRPSSSQKSQIFSWGLFAVELADNHVVGRLDKSEAIGGDLKSGEWAHVAVTASDKLVVYVNGKQAASSESKPADLSGPMSIGKGFEGQMDVVGVANVARPPAWFAIEAAQGLDGKLLGYGEPEATDEGGSHGYIGVLAGALTPDAKVVIAILALMFVVAISVMVSKAVAIARTDKSNEAFLEEFESKPGQFLDPAPRGGGASAAVDAYQHSSIARLYDTGIRELRRRAAVRTGLSAESLAAIKASIDSTLVRENQRLNQRMVLLTIAISGGPFLGLLGTVVGVMITFAAIAAQGDVNINAIAPGIAAALLATVAGLTVAIPSLFGYNYLITRIKSITADMQSFTDEFITKMAEAHTS